MADITALENRIRSLIKTNGNQEITGAVAQQILLDIADSLNGIIEAEAGNRQSGDSTLQQGINTERQARIEACTALGERITVEIQQEATARHTEVVEEKERAEAAFDKLDMVDVAGSSLQPMQITLCLRKNDGSVQDPNWRTLAELVLPSATTLRAGLMSAADKKRVVDVNKLSSIVAYLRSKKLSKVNISFSQGYYSSTNTFVDDSGWVNSELIPLEGSDVFIASIYGYNNIDTLAPVLFYDSSDNFISANGIDWFEFNDVERFIVISKFNTPTGAAKFRLCGRRTTQGTYVKGTSLYKYVTDDTDSRISIIESFESNFNSGLAETSIIDFSFTYGIITGKYLENNTGIIRKNGLYFITENIPVQLGDRFIFKYSNYNNNVYSIYNSNNEQIAYRAGTSASESFDTIEVEITQALIDAGASYIIFSCRTGYLDQYYLKKITSGSIIDMQIQQSEKIDDTNARIDNANTRINNTNENIEKIWPSFEDPSFSYNTVNGYISGNNANVVADPNHKTTELIPVNEGDVFSITSRCYNINEYTLLDSNENFVSANYIPFTSILFVDDILVIPSGVAFVRFSGYTANNNRFEIKKLTKFDSFAQFYFFVANKISALELFESNFNSGLAETSIIDFSFTYGIITGKYLENNTGTIQENIHYFITENIPVQLGDRFIFKYSNYNTNVYSIYNSNNEQIAYRAGTSASESFDTIEVEITQALIDAGASYIIFCCRKNYLDQYYLKKIISGSIIDMQIGLSGQSDKLKLEIDEINNRIKKVTIVCDGDSLTNGQFGESVSYVSTLQSLCNQLNPNKYDVINFGSPGDNTLMVMGRMGVISFVPKTDVTIPAENNVESAAFIPKFDYESLVSGDARIWPSYFVTYCNPIYVEGIKCNLIGGEQQGDGRYQYKIKRIDGGGEQKVVKAETPFITKCAKYWNNFHIVFIGMNGGFKLGSGGANVTHDEAVEYVKQCELIYDALGGNTLFLTPHMITSSYNYTSDELESLMQQRFGNKYINLRKYFSYEQCLNDAVNYGILPGDFTPTSQDLTDLANQVCPSSLRYIGEGANVIHFNQYGYALLGHLVYNRLLSLGIIYGE